MIAPNVKKALVLGIGGGGDIVSTIPTKHFLEEYGIKVILGSVVWERFHRDPFPGPRHLMDLSPIEPLTPNLGFGFKDTKIAQTGLKIIPSEIAHFYDEKVLLVDINTGPRDLARQIDEIMTSLDMDILIGVDAGGDSITVGQENGLRSPLADSIMVATLAMVRHTSWLCVIGMGSDGELTKEEMERNMSLLAREGGFIGCHSIPENAIRELRELVEKIDTEASRIPLLGAEGFYGEYVIRGGIPIHVSILSSISFYFQPSVALKINPIAEAIADAKNINEASRIINEMGIKTELDLERELYASQNLKK
jgi:hypothetical protein